MYLNNLIYNLLTDIFKRIYEKCTFKKLSEIILCYIHNCHLVKKSRYNLTTF